jgi:hypothetical protein
LTEKLTNLGIMISLGERDGERRSFNGFHRLSSGNGIRSGCANHGWTGINTDFA